LKKVNLDKMLQERDGLDTKISAGGENLSAGER